jgi:hypothetical protein
MVRRGATGASFQFPIRERAEQDQFQIYETLSRKSQIWQTASAESGVSKIFQTASGQFALHPISATALRKSGPEMRQTPSGIFGRRQICGTLSHIFPIAQTVSAQLKKEILPTLSAKLLIVQTLSEQSASH